VWKSIKSLWQSGNLARFVYLAAKSASNYPYYLYFKFRHPEARVSTLIALNFHYSKTILDFSLACSQKKLLQECSLTENSIVIDVGGYDGTWAEGVFSRYRPQMHLFEPLPSAYATLHAKFSMQPKIHIYPYGLADSNSTAALSVSGMGSSIYLDSPAHLLNPEMVTVELKDIKEVLRKLDLNEVDLININIEGGEYPLLKYMLAQGLTKRFNYIRVQFHEWIKGSHEMRAEILKGLSVTHDVEWSYPFVWESWRRKPEVQQAP
jgi:FkbM family methyltransferase